MKFFTPLLAILLTCVSSVNAQVMVLQPQSVPLDPASPSLIQDSPSAFEVRELTLPAAKDLLSSTEGPAWRVLQVQAQACENPKAKSKKARKECRNMKAQCRAADKFAHKYKKHAACSALYTQTKVLLTNDAPLSRMHKSAKSSKHSH